MSRHRFVQAFEREAYEELYDERYEVSLENSGRAQDEMVKARAEVRELVGDAFDDTEIEETLEYYNLNVTKSVRWLLEGVDADAKPKPEKKDQTKKTKPPSDTSSIPMHEGAHLTTKSSTAPFKLSPLSFPLQQSNTATATAARTFFFCSSSSSKASTLRTTTIKNLSGSFPDFKVPIPKISSLNLHSLPFAEGNAHSSISFVSKPSNFSTMSLGPASSSHSSTSCFPKGPLSPGRDNQVTSHFKIDLSPSSCIKSSSSFVSLLNSPETSFSKAFISHIPHIPSSASCKISLVNSTMRSFTPYPYPFLYPIQSECNFLFDMPSPDDKVAASRAKAKVNTLTLDSKLPLEKSTKGLMPTLKANLPSQGTTAENKPKLAYKEDLTQMLGTLELKDTSTNSTRELKKSQKELQKWYQTRRAQLNLVIVGHVDAGKSTLLGHFLYLTGNVEDKIMHKYKKEAADMGKSSFQYAWVIDATDEERDRGVTMSLGYTTFETKSKLFTFMDAPGHQDWVPQMISGACMADIACLVLDASPTAFETGLERGQTKEHALLIKAMGVGHILVLVNKMDRVHWDSARFHEIQAKIKRFLAQLNYTNVTIIPVSGLKGENLTVSTTLAPWYKGPCFLEALDQIKVPERELWEPLRLRISETKGTLVRGQIDTGSIRTGDSVLVLPHRTTGSIRAISVDGSPTTFAVAGDSVDLTLSGINSDLLFQNAVICSSSSPMTVTNTIECKVVIFNCKFPITPGFPFIFHQGSISEPGHVKALLGLLDKSSGHVTKANPRFVTKGSTALMEIVLDRSLCLEHHEKSKQFGRFSLRIEGETIGAGIVTKMFENHQLDTDKSGIST